VEGEVDSVDGEAALVTVDRPDDRDRSLLAVKACRQAVVTDGIPDAGGNDIHRTGHHLAVVDGDPSIRIDVGRDVDVGGAFEEGPKCRRHQGSNFAAAPDDYAAAAVGQHLVVSIYRDHRRAGDASGELAAPVRQGALALQCELDC